MLLASGKTPSLRCPTRTWSSCLWTTSMLRLFSIKLHRRTRTQTVPVSPLLHHVQVAGPPSITVRPSQSLRRGSPSHPSLNSTWINTKKIPPSKVSLFFFYLIKPVLWLRILKCFPFVWFTCVTGRPAVTDGSVLLPVGERGSKVMSGWPDFLSLSFVFQL